MINLIINYKVIILFPIRYFFLLIDLYIVYICLIYIFIAQS